MFPGYNDDMIDFFWSVRFNNNRGWFAEHKETYVNEVYAPTKALANDVCELINRKNKLEAGWKCSRIYRDARRPTPDGPYKDKLWFVVCERMEHWSETPTFFAEVTAEGVNYGMGNYCCAAAFMNRYRKKAESNPAAFSRLIKQFQKSGAFDRYGESYKRPKGHISEEIDPWYNMKSIGFIKFEKWNDALMSERLPEILVERFQTLMPLYRWLWDCVVPLEEE